MPPAVYTVTMEADYDPASRHLTGSEVLRWNNTASVPVDALELHLYLNAFAHDRTTFMIESRGRHRRFSLDGRGWGWIEVTSMRLPDGTDLKDGERFLRRDDGNPDDRTAARYPLPEPVPPGGWIQVTIAFEAQLPGIFARTGAHGDYVLAGQWFPKISVFEDRGVRGRRSPGWSTHQFHADSEFYADFGNYDVTLRLPARYRGKIGATGVRVREVVVGEQAEARFVQRGVHDFAWAADPRFLLIEEGFDPQAHVPAGQRREIAALLGLDPGELALAPVSLRLLLQPGNRSQARRYLDAARAALRGYGLRLGPYPYPTLTLVDPAHGAQGSGGMEYPTFVTLGTSPLMAVPPFRRVLLPEVVTVHEVGHQYFYGMLANNEVEEAWLDEGTNSYYQEVVTTEAFGPALVDLLGFKLHHRELTRLDLGPPPWSDAVVTPSWRFRSTSSYAAASYERPALMLAQLRNLVGSAPFARAMRRFFEEHRFGHPTTADFEASMARSLEGPSQGGVRRFLHQALHTTRHLDYAAGHLRRIRVPAVAGERPEREAEPAAEVGRRFPLKAHWRSSAEVVRRGELRHPVEVEMRFADGRVLSRRWDGERRWARWTFTGPTPLVSVEVDPDAVLALDLNRLNNSRTAEPDPAPASKFLAHLVFWFQNLFAATSLLA